MLRPGYRRQPRSGLTLAHISKQNQIKKAFPKKGGRLAAVPSFLVSDALPPDVPWNVSQAEEELELQQRSFGKVLLKDRDVYEARADAAEKRYASASKRSR